MEWKNEIKKWDVISRFRDEKSNRLKNVIFFQFLAVFFTTKKSLRPNFQKKKLHTMTLV